MSVEVDEIILQWALRYALGRQTFAPSDVQRAVRANLNALSTRFLKVAVSDIEEAEGEIDLNEYALGDPNIDAPGWIQLRDDMRALLVAS